MDFELTKKEYANYLQFKKEQLLINPMATFVVAFSDMPFGFIPIASCSNGINIYLNNAQRLPENQSILN